MKIEYTTGCQCDAILIDGKNEYDLTREERSKVISKIQEYIDNEGGLKTIDDFICFLYEYSSFGDNVFIKILPGITFDENDYIDNIDENVIKTITKEERRVIVHNLLSLLYPDNLNYLLQWFMPNYIGLEYLYTCGDCGDSVYSKKINI